MTDTNIFASPEAFRAELNKAIDHEIQQTNNQLKSGIQHSERAPESNSLQQDSEGSVRQDQSGQGEYADADRDANNDEGNGEGETVTSDVYDGGVEESSSTQEEGTSEKKTHLIPQSRLKQETERRRAIEQELQSEREARIRMEAYMEALQAQSPQKQQDVPKPINIDPLDSEAHNFYMSQINELKSALSQVTNQTSEFQKTNHMVNVIQNQQAQFERNHPDFNEALEHLKNVEREIASSYVDEREVDSYVHDKLRQVVTGALNKGQNTAETIYNMAKKHGFNSKAAQPKAQTPNLSAINKNMAKTASLQGVSNSAGIANQGAIDIKGALNNRKNPYSAVNPQQFRELLERAENAGRY
jgi:hypothetical protein